MTDYLYEVDRAGIVFTACADEILSAGWLVKSTSSVDGVISTGLTSLAKGDIEVGAVDANGDDALCVGIALETVSSGSYLSVATKGLYIMTASGAVTVGLRVSPGEDDATAVKNTADTEEEFHIGRCLIGCADASYCLIALNTG